MKASVIIPTYNRIEALRACLNALTYQKAMPESFEVVVVVDGATDGTLEMLAAFQPSYPLQVIHQTNRGQCAALNHGAQAAKGEILIFIDDDIIVSPQFVSEHLQLHESQSNVIGIGQLELTLPRNADWYTRCFAQEWAEHYDLLNRKAKDPTFQDCFGGNFSVPRTTFLAVGGNDVTLQRAYDVDLAYRLMRMGCTFAYLPRANGNQNQLKGYHELTSDSAKSGAACVQLSQKHPELLAPLLGAYSDQQPLIGAALRILLGLNPSPDFLVRMRMWFRLPTDNRLSYQIIARYCFWRAVRRSLPDPKSWRSLIRGVPILMYHAFCETDRPHSRYILPIRKFKQQMAWLKRVGYQVIGLQAYVNCRRENRLPPERAVIITLDDGYADNRSLGYPVLRRYGYPATIFPVSQSIGGKNTWAEYDELANRPMLNWEELREMMAGGIDIGAHTRTHPDLLEQSQAQAIEEITTAREALEQGLGASVRLFCYPYGKHNPSVEALVEQAGFQAACSTDEGKNSLITSLFRLRRVEIWGNGSLLQFALAVHFGLDRASFKRQITKKFKVTTQPHEEREGSHYFLARRTKK